MLFKPIRRIVALLVVVVLVVAGWFFLQVDPIFAGKGKEVVITVHSGDSIATVAAELHAAGVIASPFAFRVEDLILGTPLIRAGSYELRQGSSFSRVRDVLSAPPNVAVVTVNPGLTLHEVAVDVATVRGASYGDQFVKAATSANAPSPYGANNNLEGLIGSGTYIISPDMSARALVRAMVARFVKQAKADGLTPTTRVNGLDAYQLITAASIVEKEGYYPVNMPKVARVIYNRLARGGPLQMDSTVLYYFGQDGGAPTHAQEETPTPYNTYLNTGLTPTPICTVSHFSLGAVLHAPPGPWLYFTLVSKQGKMAFSTTFAEQLKNEQLAASRGIG